MIDQNRIVVGKAWDGDMIQPLLVNSSNRLEIEQLASTVGTPAQKTKIDQNYTNTMYGLSSLDSTTLVPLTTDTDGYLKIEFT
jgi:hypothetical protein